MAPRERGESRPPLPLTPLRSGLKGARDLPPLPTTRCSRVACQEELLALYGPVSGGGWPTRAPLRPLLFCLRFFDFLDIAAFGCFDFLGFFGFSVFYDVFLI